MKKSTIFFYLLFLLFGCNSTNKVQSSGKSIGTFDIPDIVKSDFSENDSLLVIPNKNGNLVLYLSISKTTSANPNSNSKIVVYNQSLNQVLISENYSNSLVRWFNNNQLLLTRFFGINEDPVTSNIKYFLIDVFTKEVTEFDKGLIDQNLK